MVTVTSDQPLTNERIPDMRYLRRVIGQGHWWADPTSIARGITGIIDRHALKQRKGNLYDPQPQDFVMVPFQSLVSYDRVQRYFEQMPPAGPRSKHKRHLPNRGRQTAWMEQQGDTYSLKHRGSTLMTYHPDGQISYFPLRHRVLGPDQLLNEVCGGDGEISARFSASECHTSGVLMLRDTLTHDESGARRYWWSERDQFACYQLKAGDVEVKLQCVQHDGWTQFVPCNLDEAFTPFRWLRINSKVMKPAYVAAGIPAFVTWLKAREKLGTPREFQSWTWGAARKQELGARAVLESLAAGDDYESIYQRLGDEFRGQRTTRLSLSQLESRLQWAVRKEHGPASLTIEETMTIRANTLEAYKSSRYNHGDLLG